ncbi:hypothetical protein SAMN05660462_00272 [Proteiniborus ethanoligenes]|uniref:Uncharacterized protein n=1 Tax=Proteiniborus ethanoligenes TaxID=415015 RepID=A0A1H3KRE8_9FIRM|nr:hypothetical protein [Proteiniborus ethanoligenes]SDY54235.1 hypothetical protein SAMN05660462_00272 [Proteiniborus ethanoligenes]
MKNNIVTYRAYKRLSTIYLNSLSVQAFSGVLSKVFQIITTSKTFQLLFNSKNVFKDSIIYKLFCVLLKALKSGLKKNGIIENTLKDSYFISFFTRILHHKEKRAINSLYLILSLALLMNMGFKTILGSFTLAGNKNFILMALGLIILYFLQLDYVTIMKNSRIIAFTYNILYDESFNHENEER